MYCTKCGSQLPDGAKFCTRCGSPVGSYVPPRQEQHVNAAAPELRPVKFFSFGESVKNYFTNYVNFRGRATRAEFWWVFLFNFIVGLVIGMIQAPFMATAIINGLMFGHFNLFSFYIPSIIYSLAVLLPTLGLYWRRLHDTGKSGLFFLMCLIPIAGVIILIVFCCQQSDGDNIYGPRKTE